MDEEEKKKQEKEAEREAKEKAAKEKQEEYARIKEDAEKKAGQKLDNSEVNKEIEKIEADTERIKKAIAENKKAKAEAEMGGITDAGQSPIKKTENEEWAEDAKKRYEGTGMDPTPETDSGPTKYS